MSIYVCTYVYSYVYIHTSSMYIVLSIDINTEIFSGKNFQCFPKMYVFPCCCYTQYLLQWRISKLFVCSKMSDFIFLLYDKICIYVHI